MASKSSVPVTDKVNSGIQIWITTWRYIVWTRMRSRTPNRQMSNLEPKYMLRLWVSWKTVAVNKRNTKYEFLLPPQCPENGYKIKAFITALETALCETREKYFNNDSESDIGISSLQSCPPLLDGKCIETDTAKINLIRFEVRKW